MDITQQNNRLQQLWKPKERMSMREHALNFELADMR